MFIGLKLTQLLLEMQHLNGKKEDDLSALPSHTVRHMVYHLDIEDIAQLSAVSTFWSGREIESLFLFFQLLVESPTPFFLEGRY